MSMDYDFEREAERAVENGECAAQLEIKDAELRESMVRNVAAYQRRAWAAAFRALAEKMDLAPRLKVTPEFLRREADTVERKP